MRAPNRIRLPFGERWRLPADVGAQHTGAMGEIASLAHADEPGVQVGLLRRRRASVAARVTVVYAARAVGSIPLMSGGLLVVEAVLVPGLVSGGMTLASAICAMLIYRLISLIFIAAIGWVVFFFMFRTEKDGDPDAALQDEDAEIADPPQFMPDPEAPHEPEP